MLLEYVGKHLLGRGWTVGNIDATIVAQQPKLAPHIPQMVQNIAQTLNIPEDRVNIKATTEEGMGFTGTGDGIAAHAVCMLEQSK